MPVNVGLELTPLPAEHSVLRTGPRSAEIESSAPAALPAPVAPAFDAGDTISASRWNALPHFSPRAKSAAKAGGIFALLGGAFAVGHYDQAIAHAFHPRSRGPVAVAEAPSAPCAGSLGIPLEIVNVYANETWAQELARRYDSHGKMYVAKELRAPYDDFLEYTKDVPGAQNTLDRLATAKPYSSDSVLRIDPDTSSSFDDNANRISWNSTLQYFFLSNMTIGTNSAAAVLLGLLKRAEDASRNYGAYLTRTAMAHPDHNTLEILSSTEALNRDLAALPNEDARLLSTGIVEKNAANVTDASPKGLSEDELQTMNDGAIIWNDTTAKDYAGNQAEFGRRREKFFSDAPLYAQTFDLPTLREIKALIARGEYITAEVADARINGSETPALRQQLENYTRSGLAVAERIHYVKHQWTVQPDPDDAAPAPAPAAVPASAPAYAPEIGPLQAP